MEVDIGTGSSQIVAGIAKAYDPEKLIGREVVIVATSPAAQAARLESNGMIVAASLGDDGLPVLGRFLGRCAGRGEAEVSPVSSFKFRVSVMRFGIVFERTETGWSADSLCSGVGAAGVTKSETARVLLQAIELHLQDLQTTVGRAAAQLET